MLMLFLSVIDDEKNKLKFNNVYNAYHRHVYNVALEVLKNPYDAEEASQDAWFSIARNIDTIDISNEFMLESYLSIAARNAAYNVYRRKNKKIVYIDMDNLYDSKASNDVDAQEILEREESYQKIVKFIKSLPEIYIDVLSLHFLFDFSTRQIASSLGLKYSTAKQRLTRGKKLLQLILNEENN